jgi:hypothetical protein
MSLPATMLSSGTSSHGSNRPDSRSVQNGHYEALTLVLGPARDQFDSSLPLVVRLVLLVLIVDFPRPFRRRSHARDPEFLKQAEQAVSDHFAL